MKFKTLNKFKLLERRHLACFYDAIYVPCLFNLNVSGFSYIFSILIAKHIIYELKTVLQGLHNSEEQKHY